MASFYAVDVKRSISAAAANIYLNGSKHPDRVMSEHDFVYILDGEWEIYENQSAYLLRPDDVILLHAGQHHYSNLPCKPGTKTLFLHIERNESDQYNTDSTSAIASKCVQLNTIIHCQNRLKVKRLFEDIIASGWENSPLTGIRQSLLINLLLCELAEQETTTLSGQSVIVDNVLRMILSNPQRFYTANELASEQFISARTLVNMFKRQYGKTVYRYQLDIKLATVKLEISRYAGITLRELALNYGFCDEFHLSKLFKVKYGLSPRDFKKEGMS